MYAQKPGASGSFAGSVSGSRLGSPSGRRPGSASGTAPGSGRTHWRSAALAALALSLSAAVSVAAPTGADATTATAHRTAAGQDPRLGKCAPGELCLWPQARFRGERHTYRPRADEPGRDRSGKQQARSAESDSAGAGGARTARFGDCERLPGGAGARSFANRTGRPVTVYESAECAETRDFHTHPSGAWTPQGAYTARAFKVWEK